MGWGDRPEKRRGGGAGGVGESRANMSKWSFHLEKGAGRDVGCGWHMCTYRVCVCVCAASVFGGPARVCVLLAPPTLSSCLLLLQRRFARWAVVLALVEHPSGASRHVGLACEEGWLHVRFVFGGVGACQWAVLPLLHRLLPARTHSRRARGGAVSAPTPTEGKLHVENSREPYTSISRTCRRRSASRDKPEEELRVCGRVRVFRCAHHSSACPGPPPMLTC